MIVLPHPSLGPMVNAVGAACRICRRVQSAASAVSKEDRSPVTIADFAAQAVVSNELATLFPEVPLVAEEDSGLLALPENEAILAAVIAAAGREWTGAGEAGVLEAIDRGAVALGTENRFFTLDPIDGTKGFLRGDQYAVALALLEDGEVIAGVLGCPSLPGPAGGEGSMLVAVKGTGAFALRLDEPWRRVLPVRVSKESDPVHARFCESVEKAHSHKGRSARIAESIGVTAPPVRVDSQAKYALVCRGDAELYLRIPRDDVYREKIWDHAAGSIVVSEAGGTVTDLDGKPLKFGAGRTLDANRGIVASNGHIHDAVLEAAAATE